MRKIYRKIKFILIKLYIDIYSYFKTFNSSKKIAIVSCNKWKNKILEDIRLKYYLSSSGIKTNIISWENSDISGYDAIIIRSVWGFSKDKFYNWLKEVNDKNIKIFNDIDLIKNNFSKKNQFDILTNHNIKHVPTYYIKNNKNLENELQKLINSYGKIVVKPDISESGSNTYVIPGDNKIKNSVTLNEFLGKKINTDIFLAQPFLSDIDEGEVSVIVINKEISHVIRRFPGIFNSYKNSEEINLNDLDSDMHNTVNKILKIKEYNNQLYMRIDFIKRRNEYLVLEIELIDPILFFNTIENKNNMNEAYIRFARVIKDRMEK